MNPLLMSAAAEFTATGQVQIGTIPAQAVPTKYALQVTGVDANGAVVAVTAWDVQLIGGLDNLAFNESSKILEHVQTSQKNGDTIYSSGAFFPARYWVIKCKALTLGAAVKIKVQAIGVN